MKIYNGGPIYLGILVFLAIALFPFYNNFGKTNKPPEPKTDTPEILKYQEEHGGKKECVEPKEFMRAEHMVVLNNWRDAVVREDNRGYLSSINKRWNMSLQNECMRCHSNKKKFCDECHNYMAVKPFCWDCHIQPVEKEETQS
jgi:hypothetical protein